MALAQRSSRLKLPRRNRQEPGRQPLLASPASGVVRRGACDLALGVVDRCSGGLMGDEGNEQTTDQTSLRSWRGKKAHGIIQGSLVRAGPHGLGADLDKRPAAHLLSAIVGRNLVRSVIAFAICPQAAMRTKQRIPGSVGRQCIRIWQKPSSRPARSAVEGSYLVEAKARKVPRLLDCAANGAVNSA